MQLIYEIDSITLRIIYRKTTFLLIEAKGKTRTSFWSNPELHFKYAIDNTYEFDFMATPPPSGTITLPVLSNISAYYMVLLENENKVGVVVNAENNKKEEHIIDPGFAKIKKSENHAVNAIGYSANFSFDEAFKDAIRHLPHNNIPDSITSVRVLETGASFGGFIGINMMYVLIEALIL